MTEDKQGLLDTNWEQIKQEMRDLLIGLAKVGHPIAYSELAAQLKTVYLHYRAPAFGQLLREIGQEESAAGRPMLAVLVVNKQTGRCGGGFFSQAASKGYDVSDPESFWQAEFRRVHEYWSNNC